MMMMMGTTSIARLKLKNSKEMLQCMMVAQMIIDQARKRNKTQSNKLTHLIKWSSTSENRVILQNMISNY